MGKEEQQEEREVLASIFPDEITEISDTEFRIAVKLDIPDDDEESEPPTLILSVSYPENYPDEAPRLDISAPPNSPKHIHLDVQEDKAQLLSDLTPTIEENMGMAMVFTLVTTLKDNAEMLISERKQAAEKIREIEIQKAEEEENKKFHGTAVTRESFLEWRERFRKEMEENKRREQEEKEAEDKKKKGAKDEKKLTGREIWERGLAGKVEDEDEGEDGLDGMEQLKVSA